MNFQFDRASVMARFPMNEWSRASKQYEYAVDDSDVDRVLQMIQDGKTVRAVVCRANDSQFVVVEVVRLLFHGAPSEIVQYVENPKIRFVSSEESKNHPKNQIVCVVDDENWRLFQSRRKEIEAAKTRMKEIEKEEIERVKAVVLSNISPEYMKLMQLVNSQEA